MKRFASLVLALSFVLPSAGIMTASDSYAASDRQEVKERLELNQISAEQLAATGACSLEIAKKIVDLREQLGSFQSYDDLGELELPEDTLNQVRYNTTIQGIASDCNC